MFKLAKNILLLITILLSVNSCISRIEKHGYMFDLSDHQKLKEEITTKELTLQLMGSPTIIDEIGNNEIWIYYSEDVKKNALFKPKVLDRTIISIQFDKDVISKIKRYNLSDQSNIEFATNYTKVNSNKVGFFESIVKNIGNVKAQ